MQATSEVAGLQLTFTFTSSENPLHKLSKEYPNELITLFNILIIIFLHFWLLNPFISDLTSIDIQKSYCNYKRLHDSILRRDDSRN
jgi:hypothetical protein